MQEHCSPWGFSNVESNNQEHYRGFEDSFSPESYNDPNTTEYVPLDDSPQYLQSLERKLNRVQGRTSGQRKKESRQLIDALAGSRSSHTHHFLQNQDETVSTFSENDESLAASNSSSTIDPQSALGVMMRRVVPDKVALSHEELCQLLEADILAKVTEALHEEEDQNTQQQNTVQQNAPQHSSENNKTNEESTNFNIKENLSDIQAPVEEKKEHSSDEGEK